ncbi:galactosyltransferase-related protein [Helicobacter pullorum]
MALLSIIIPFGTSKERPYIKERVIQKARKYKSNEKIEYIFVEGFSSLVCKEIPLIIAECGHEYYKDEKQQKFSQGQCRNLGVMYANSPAVMALDVDCYLSQKNLEKLLEIIQIKGIDKNPNAFLVLPCAYLKEEGNEFLLSKPEEMWDSLVGFDVQSGANKLVKFYSPASSSMVLNRHKYLEIGGNDNAYIGHGYEDFDFMMRIFKSCAVFEKMPMNLDFDFRNWSFDSFKGFRAWFSIVGNEMAAFGIYLYHFWHI